jgi:diguanylate cyclase (GGDEF)-like protein/PAS domain S-box-containing protein
VVENSSEIVTVVDPDGTLRYANPALERALGYDPEEAVGTMNVLDHVHAEDLPHVLEETERALSEGGIATNEAEYRFRHKDGSWRWIQSVGTYLLDDPEVRGVAVVSRDVTARVEAGERLRFQAQLLDTVGEAVIALDVEGRVAYWNRAAEALYGWSSEEAMGGLLRDMVVSEDLQGRAGEIAGQLREGRAWRGEFVVRRRDGTKFPVEGTSTPVFGEDGGVIGVIGVLRDVAERKETEEALRESRAEIFSVLERITDAFFALDHEFRFTYVNSQASDLFSNSIEDLLGKPIWEDPTFYPEYRRALLQGRTARFEACYPPTGAWYNVRAYPSGTGLSVYLQDVTERKRAEEALKESEERYRTLVETVPAVTYTDRAAGSYPDVAVYTSPQIEALVGYTVREWLDPERDLWRERLHPEDRAWVLAADGHAKATGEPFAEEYRLIARDGRVVWVRDEAALTRDEAGEPRYWQGVLVDVTERKVAEEAMKESEEHFRALTQNSSDVVTLLEATGTIRYQSPSMQRVLGYEPEETIGDHVLDYVHPDDLERVAIAFAEGLTNPGSRSSVEYRFRHKDGSWVWLESVGTNLLEDPKIEEYVVNSRDITRRKETESRLREAEKRYRTLVEQIPAVTFVDRVGGSSDPVYVSPQIEEMLGYTPEEWMAGRLWRDRLHPDDRGRVLASDERFEAGGGRVDEEYRLLSADGSVVWVREETVLVRGEGGEPLYVQGILTDVTERKLAEEAMKESERSLAAAQRIAHVGNFEYSVEDDRARWSDELYRIFGFAPQQFAPTYKGFMRSVHPDDRDLVKGAIREALFGERWLAFDYRIVRRDGEVRSVRSDYEVVRDASGRAVRLVGTVLDVTEHKALEEQLEHQALHDPLTHLPNRRLFANRLLHALERTRRRGGVAVLFMDLDDFKVVNDSLGHETGDLLLVVVAQRLSRCLRPGDTLARFGGDEFVVLLEDVEDPDEAVRVAERIVRELRRPFVLGGRELYAPASIGVSWGDARTKSSEDLLRDADTAMYQAKREGSAYRVFDPAMYERVVRRLALENDLRRAVEAGEFVVHYQPVFDFGSQEPWGVEALVRWNHPERGMLGPAEFVTVAEEMGLIVPIGSRVLEEACHRVKGWQETHPRNPPLGLIVNLSVAQLLHPGYEETVRSALARSGLGAESLKLDVTESAFIDALESNRLALERIQALGVRTSIDDFGMGYSSLSYLKRLPADALKIDKSFVKGFGEDAQDTAIVRMVVELAHTLGMEVVAEGVETWAQAALLAEMGCDMAQGYHFARPLPAEAVAGFLGSAYPDPAHRSDAGGPPDG